MYFKIPKELLSDGPFRQNRWRSLARGILWLAVVVALPLVISSGCSASGKTVTQVDTTNGLTRSVSVPARVTEGTPIPISIVYSNGGTKTVEWDELIRTGYPLMEWRLSHTTKKSIKSEEALNKMVNFPDEKYNAVVVSLNPEESHTYVMDLNRAFYLPPGKYTFSLDWMNLRHIDFTEPANVIFEVVPAK